MITRNRATKRNPERKYPRKHPRFFSKTFLLVLAFLSIYSHPLFSNSSLSAGNTEDESSRTEQLNQGKILTDGGFLTNGVWGKMEGVVEASPEIVWRLFYLANDWKNYKLPTLVDSRNVTPKMSEQLSEIKNVNDAYQIIGQEIINSMSNRKKGATWMDYVFQYYDLPWPVANRWFVAKTDYNETEINNGIYKAVWVRTAGNIRTLEGEMTLKPFAGNKNRTLMIYSVNSDPGTFVPKFLLKWGLKKTMPDSIYAIRRAAAEVSRRSQQPILRIQ